MQAAAAILRRRGLGQHVSQLPVVIRLFSLMILTFRLKINSTLNHATTLRRKINSSIIVNYATAMRSSPDRFHRKRSRQARGTSEMVFGSPEDLGGSKGLKAV